MRFCGMCGRELASRGGPGERERRSVSVVFIDLMGFSTLTHGLDPEDLRDLADEVLTVVAGVVEDYDGYVDAFRGDGLIAVFGAPHSHPDDPYRAVVAAAAGLKAIERIGVGKGLDLHGRAGVTTGIVVAGSVGSGRVREYTVMGSVVNLASRLEGAASPGQVLVSRDTYDATRHRLSFERVDDLTLAGFPNVTSAYGFVADREQHADPYHSLPFVGRERELTQLEHALQGVRAAGRARTLWLVGEAGSGKTRLLQAFAERTPAATTRTLWLALQREPADHIGSIDWGLLAEQLLGVHQHDDERTRAVQAQLALERYLPGDARWQRLILISLGLQPKPTWTRLERRAIDRTMVAWRDVLLAVARSEPGRALLLVCPSERYAPALDEFATLIEEAAGPILLVRPSRGRDVPEGADTLPLGPLSPDESLRLLDLVVDPIFAVAARSLVQQVGGVPASVFELARALAITQDANVAGSLVSLLQARLDGFEPPARRMLAVGALTGERTWEAMLAAVVPEARDHLGALREGDVLVQEPDGILAGHVAYRFRSELLRRAVLQMIPFAERPALHLRIATWLEQHAPLAFAEQIAQHFERGGALEAAYAHYLAGASEAVSAGDRARAERLYQALARLELDAELVIQAALAQAEAALGWGMLDAADDALQRATERLDDCRAESCERLAEVLERLRIDLQHARHQAAADDDDRDARSASPGPAAGPDASAGA